MAREHDQKSTNGQKPDLNELQPGMEVEDTGHELGEGDISKPRVSNVIRDKQGQVKYVIIGKGLLFKKMVLVPANRIKEVRQEPQDKKGLGEIVIETTLEDEQELKKRGLDILADIEKGDLLAEVQEAMPTAEGLEALEAESEQQERKQGKRNRKVSMSMLHILVSHNSYVILVLAFWPVCQVMTPQPSPPMPSMVRRQAIASSG